VINVAAFAALSAYNGAAHLAYLFGNGDLRTEDFLDKAERQALGDFVYKIRERATPEVLAQQRVISGLRKTADLTRPEEIALKIFTATILELDRYDDDERMRLAREAAREPIQPLPIEDTTMELVDDVMGSV
jgi:hypothetical protein